MRETNELTIEEMTHQQRMELAEERAKDLHKFLNMQDVMNEHRKKIAPLLIEEKYKKNLLCMFNSHSPFTKPWHPTIGMKFVGAANYSCDGVLENFITQLKEGYTLPNITLGENDKMRTFMSMPRNQVEYNHLFVQLCVCVILQDNHGNIIILKNNPDSDGRIKGTRSLIQGHVEVSNDINMMSGLEYLKHEAIREINEEISGVNVQDTKELHLIGVLHYNKTQVTMEHLNVIFMAYIDGSFNEMNISTNEPDKHTVEIHSKYTIHNLENIDNIIKFCTREVGKE